MAFIGKREMNVSGTVILHLSIAAFSLLSACKRDTPAARSTEAGPTGANAVAQGSAFSAPLHSAAQVEAEWYRCRDGERYPSPQLRAECDDKARRAYQALNPATTGHGMLTALLSDLYDPFVFWITGGEDALNARVAVGFAMTQFMKERSLILSDVSGSSDAVRHAPSDLVLLEQIVADKTEAAQVDRRWQAVRSADCAAYPVRNCTRRLDAAFGSLIADIIKTR